MGVFLNHPKFFILITNNPICNQLQFTFIYNTLFVIKYVLHLIKTLDMQIKFPVSVKLHFGKFCFDY